MYYQPSSPPQPSRNQFNIHDNVNSPYYLGNLNTSTPIARDLNHVNIDNSDTSLWSMNVPLQMPWIHHLPGESPITINNPVRFTAGYPPIHNVPSTGDILVPDPCTSSTATRWELLNKLSPGSFYGNSNLHLKRRKSSDDDDDDEDIRRPSKQYINEERVAARLTQLHISQDYTQSSIGNEENINDMFDAETIDSTPVNEDPIVVLSDEVKKVLKNQDVLGELTRRELERSCKAVVLWQPVANHLQNVKAFAAEETNSRNNKEPSTDVTFDSMEV